MKTDREIEAEIIERIMNEELCEHGLSAWLCMGPNHYPTDEQERNGDLW